MIIKTVVVLLVVCMFWFGVACTRFKQKDAVIDYTCGLADTLFVVQSRTKIECHVLCVGQATCRSTFWHPASKTCTVCGATYDGTSSQTSSPGNIYYEREIKEALNAVCQEDWLYFMGSCYQLVMTSMSRDIAQSNCETYGGHLVDIKTEDEMNFIKQLFIAMSNGATNLVWIGAFEPSANYAAFYWTDGTLLTDGYSNFVYVLRRSCVYFDPARSFVWENNACSLAYWSLCEVGQPA